MASKRQLQVAEMIKRNFGIVLQQEGSYIYGVEPLVTVTKVEVSPDLSVGKIYLSVYNVEDKQTVLLEMEENHHRLKQGLAARLKRHLRRLPNFELFLDDTLDEMYRLNNLFSKMHQEKQFGEDKE
ncbi:MAG: 30S ribosome-binding factor RbfA [Saprospiraceae bacterium]